MWKRFTLAIAVTLAIGTSPLTASAAGSSYSLSASGALVGGGGDCSGDAYDVMTCPSDPTNHTTCGCDTYSANISGNQSGTVTNLSGTLHVVTDFGAASDTPDCQPLYGQLSFTGSKDTETIYLNGSHCFAQTNGASEAFVGGWGMFSSSANLKALGTFKMTRKQDNSYTMKLSGKTQ